MTSNENIMLIILFTFNDLTFLRWLRFPCISLEHPLSPLKLIHHGDYAHDFITITTSTSQVGFQQPQWEDQILDPHGKKQGQIEIINIIFKHLELNTATLRRPEAFPHHFNFSRFFQVWMPDTFFRNEKEAKFHDIIQPNLYVRVFPNGDVLYSIRVRCQGNILYSKTLNCFNRNFKSVSGKFYYSN